MSSRLPGRPDPAALAFVLLASSLKLFGVSSAATRLILSFGVLLIAPPLWMLAGWRTACLRSPLCGHRPGAPQAT